MSTENVFGETIYSYSRKQAIEDGVLVDLSQIESIKQHWKYPLACTDTVWSIIEKALTRPSQDRNPLARSSTATKRLPSVARTHRTEASHSSLVGARDRTRTCTPYGKGF